MWSHAAESALVDAYSFSGGPRPCHGFVLGRGAARFRRVRLGCCRVRKVRRMLLTFMKLLMSFCM